MFETFEHTADIGLRIRAPDLDTLLAEAGRALFTVMVDNLAEVRPIEEVCLTVEGDQPDELLRDWLGELLFTFHTRRLVLSQFDVCVGPDGLTGRARGEPLDLERHHADVEVKAITWHGLKVEREGDGWLAEVIVDI
jgi:SHS2 domain-containing protein